MLLLQEKRCLQQKVQAHDLVSETGDLQPNRQKV